MSEENENVVEQESLQQQSNGADESAQTEAPTVKKTVRRKKSDGVRVSGKVDTDLFVESLSEISKESLVSAETISDILIDAMRQTYLEMLYPGIFKERNSTDPAKELIQAKVAFSQKLNKFSIFDIKTVVREDEDDLEDPAYQISLEEAKKISKKSKIGDQINVPFDISTVDEDLISIKTKEYMKRVKQLFDGKLKEASRNAILTNYKDQMGGLITGTITKADPSLGNYEVSFGKAEGFLRKQKRNMLPNDVFTTGDLVTCFLIKVNETTFPPSLDVSRTNAGFVQKLMEREIPEIASGIIKVKGIAREAGKRTKVFVESTRPNIDPVGTCIGPESSRQRAISSVLKSEKIEFAKYSTNKAVQIINALVPAEVIGVVCLDDFFDSNVHYEEFENDQSYIHPDVTVIVNNGAQGTAIGADGSNVRLASKLTKCKITIMQVDEAMKEGVHPTMTPEILRIVSEMEKAQKEEEALNAPSIPTQSEQQLPVEDNFVDNLSNSDVQLQPESTPVVTKTPTSVSVQPSDEVEHIEIKNKPKISLEQLEKQLENANKKKQGGYSKSKKKDKDEEEEEKKSSIASSVEAMPIYTDDELEQMDDSSEEEDYSDYYNEEDEEYDSDYESYYDDQN